MSPLLIVLIGIAIVLTIRTVRRNVVDNHSVKHHHRALDTLGEISQHQERVAPLPDQPTAHPHVRVVPPSEPSTGRFDHAVRRAVAPPPVVPPPIVPPATAPIGAEDAPLPETPEPAEPAARGALVFDDTRSDPVASPAAPVPPPALTPSARAHPPTPPQPAAAAVVGSLATARTGYIPPAPARKRPLSDYQASRWVLAGVGVVSIVIAVVGILMASSGPSHSTRAPARVAGPAHKTTPSTTPTTIAPADPAVLIGQSTDGASYSLVPTAQLQLVATDRCWVEIRTGSSSGAIVFRGLMQPGDHQPLPPGTSLWLRLGNPAGISIVINGQPLHLAAVPSTSQPFNITFQPAA
jgi:hypothetical protein